VDRSLLGRAVKDMNFKHIIVTKADDELKNAGKKILISIAGAHREV
jgi:lipoate synthase